MVGGWMEKMTNIQFNDCLDIKSIEWCRPIMINFLSYLLFISESIFIYYLFKMYSDYS